MEGKRCRVRKSNGFTRGDGGENQVVRVVVRSEIDGDGGRGRAVPKGKTAAEDGRSRPHWGRKWEGK